jgi:peptidoglycan/xylan/chitin deacetylase (PgdA/CDA1 family)
MKAPALPDLSKFKLSDYPTPDVIPPTDSPQVQQWKDQVAKSGVQIPSFGPTVSGGCPTNPEAAADKSRCWWTCGGCTREDDISECPEPRSWGLTYDDGPAFYTPNLLDYLDEQKLKATFFIIGSRAAYLPAVLQREYLAGHQISVHTWSHHLLTEMTNDQIIAELGWSMKIIKDITGVTPNTFRPPQGDMDDRVRAIAKAMGLKPIMWTRVSPTVTFNTQDFDINSGLVTPNQVLYNWKNILNNATTMNTGFIVLEHDLWPQCVEIATGYILPDALAHDPKFKIEPVNTCLGKDMKEAYIELASATAGNATGNSSSSGSGANGDGNSATLRTVPGVLALAAVFLTMLAL